MQFRNALGVARGCGIRTVYLPGFRWIKEGVHELPCGTRLVNLLGAVFDDELVLLVGRFFDISSLEGFAPQPLTCHEAIGAIGHLVILDRDREPLEEDHLVIHLRAGDIFSGGNVHPNYGQPPLAFYLRVLEEGPWRRVTMMAQDEGNPVWNPLRQFASAAFPTEAFTGRPLQQDLEFLLRARSLVAPSGTFCRGVAAMSGNLALVHSFDETFDPWGNAAVGVVRWVDTAGTYREQLLSRNWRNSPDQRDLMIRYPGRHIDPVSGAPQSLGPSGNQSPHPSII